MRPTFQTTLGPPRARSRTSWFLGIAWALALVTAHAASAGPRPGARDVFPAEHTACTPWARWHGFKERFIDDSGHVVDVGSADHRSVSEGQAYGLFAALVANDRPVFDRLLAATQMDFAGGSLADQLPAWIWGRQADGGFGVLDRNSASDADLWIAYTLLEAGRLWKEPGFAVLGERLAGRILANEAVQIPGLGWTILPGSIGFHISESVWRLNPSYLPPQVLRGIATALPQRREWRDVVASSLAVLLHTAPNGFSPDWVLYQVTDDSGKFIPDTLTRAEGSYNAIRVYLWTGMVSTSAKDGYAARLLKLYRPMANYVEDKGFPPEKVDTSRGSFGASPGNSGFSAALAPFLVAQGRPDLARAQLARVNRLEARQASGYYSQALSLFGLGWMDGRFRFSPDGRLMTSWHDQCEGGQK